MHMGNDSNTKVNDISLDDLYGHLKNTDSSLLRRLNNPNITDQDYLFCGLLYNLISSTQSIIINKVSANIDSFGVDINCKNIIETICLLNYISTVPVSDEVAKLFRFVFSFKSSEEIKSLFEKEDKNQIIYKILTTEKEKAIKIIESATSLKKEDIDSRIDSLDSHFAFLKKTIEEKINFNELLEKYPVYNEIENQAYAFFTSANNVYFDIDSNNKLQIDALRKKYIDIVIDYATTYVTEYNFINTNLQSTSFSKDFINNPTYKNHIENVSWLNGAFEYIKDTLGNINNKKDNYSLYFYDKLNKLCIDMFFCLSLGLSEQVLNKFRVFVEMVSLDYHISNLSNEDKDNIVKGLYLLTRARINQYLINTKQGSKFECDKELKELFDSYYKDKYKMESYDEFKKHFIINYLYFIKQDIKSYSPLIKELVDDMTKNKKFSNDFELLYKISCDFESTSRYKFASGNLIYDTLAQKALKIVFDYLIESLSFKEGKLKKENVKISLEDAINIFSDFANNQEIIVEENIKFIADNVKL